MTNAYETIRYERHGFVGRLTLNRPEKRNAQNPRMWDELADLGAGLKADETLRCLVVQGEGPTFSAGIDLVEGMAGLLLEAVESGDDEALFEIGRRGNGAVGWISELECASVAAIHGHAYGAGLQLALACDFRIFAEGSQAGVLETRYGLLPDMGATVRLPRIVGESRARELILLGETVDSAEALRIGLANQVVAPGDLDAAAAELAARLAAQPPVAIAGARRAIEAAWHLDPGESLRQALEGQLRCLKSDDFEEGYRAFAAGRPPEWKGR